MLLDMHIDTRYRHDMTIDYKYNDNDDRTKRQ